jgi:sporulation protein YlmC with PRC-barrel domain
MRLKQLRGLPVIDPTAARKIGTVSDYQVDPASGCVAALDVAATEDGKTARIVAQRIRRVGQSAVILTARGGASANTPADVNDHWLDSSTLVGLEVMGDDGNRIGRLLDADFDQDTLTVAGYVLHASLWERLLSRGGRIVPEKVHACSRELMLLSTGQVTEPHETAVAAETVGIDLPLKSEDRLVAPTFEQVPDGHTVGSRSH